MINTNIRLYYKPKNIKQHNHEYYIDVNDFQPIWDKELKQKMKSSEIEFLYPEVVYNFSYGSKLELLKNKFKLNIVKWLLN